MAKNSMAEQAPQITDAVLLKYLDGLANSTERKAIESSETLKARAGQLAGEQKRWSHAVFRAECPPSLTLGEHALHLLTRPELLAIEGHLSTCPLCTADLAEMRAFIGDSPHSKIEEILAVGRRIVAQLLEAPQAEAAMQTRGAGMGTRIYAAGDLQLILSVQPDPDDKKRRNIVGLASGEEARGMVAHLLSEGKWVQLAEVDEFGNFRFAGVDPGVFGVLMRGEGVTVEIEAFQV